ncbi:7-alpha-hydroxysteroid dehydrogenase [[Clostridium] sordellii]|uniref:3-oxoacyl-[acyl-carrier protein] reductase n=2 Tax=Paraclostridium sordellii TaxID=1505 RepID=A0A9P1P9N5_PARSO|nr:MULTISPECIES: 3-oxoacyl-ACP reductase family protein [Paeniclostridium]EPZ56915.1 short chain dehydrogenase family protein [[Clostridium] sordellii VPI 9048] [Paeniclostridium sordellii VPI 9048]MBW4864342.1 3-oxoacyl-ACP reductase FabG [Paeniclostridium sp.]MBW4872437.1 3-oxoacyl-ACP reductase FabG [Paeniclostridium sp.]MBX9181536.1 3-oxoacyl-ACP reductase FabG [Paeniclostridium sordellii]MCH1966734.1 3-oxoacyl-ACP reductase FabG [Paeniclostridium sordellii]
MKLKNKVAIVTGGSRGIGFAIVDRYIKEGAKVAICGSKAETANKALNLIQEKYPNSEVMAVHANMSSSDEINEMFKQVVDKWGYVDILVNNAGITATKDVDLMTDEEFEKVMDINVTGVFRCTRAAVKIMKDHGGNIINTSSLVSVNGAGRQCAYTASKFAVNGLTRSFARELGKYNIRVNAVAPGSVATEMVKEFVTDQMVEYMKQMTPLGKMAEPYEMAGAYVYLASEDSSYTTGATLNIDGGIVM